jgi:hypothetical protein
MKNSPKEMPRVPKIAKFLDKLKAGSVRSIGRDREMANGMCSGDTGSDELGSREERGEVSVAYEGLGTKSDRITVLVHVSKSEVAVSRDSECTTHEGQRGRRKRILEKQLRRVTGIDNGVEDGEGVEQGVSETEIEDNNDANIIEVADGSKMGGPVWVSRVPSVFSVGTQDDSELGAERTAHRDA